MKKLFRSRNERMLCGVLGGISEYLDCDVTILRVFTVLLFIFTGIIPITITYFICSLIMPNNENS